MCDKWQSNDLCFLRYGVQWTECFVILDPFWHFYPPNNLKIKPLKKMKKILRDIIILHMCTRNDNHIMYGSWDMEHNGHNFLSFWTIFCPFTTLTTQKIKILKKGKKPWRYYHFTHVFDKWQKFLSFWTLFHPLTPLTTWKIKILKKWKKNKTNIQTNKNT